MNIQLLIVFAFTAATTVTCQTFTYRYGWTKGKLLWELIKKNIVYSHRNQTFVLQQNLCELLLQPCAAACTYSFTAKLSAIRHLDSSLPSIFHRSANLASNADRQSYDHTAYPSAVR